MLEGIVDEKHQKHTGRIEGVIQRAMQGHQFLSARALWNRIYTELECEAQRVGPRSDYGQAILQARKAIIGRNHHASVFRVGTKSNYNPKPYLAINGFAVVTEKAEEDSTPQPTYR